MKKFRYIIILGCFIFLVNCSKDSSAGSDPVIPKEQNPGENVLSSAKELINFSVLATDNPELKVSADVQKTGSEFKLFFPANTDLTALTVTFEVSSKASLKIDGALATTGTTTTDFTSPLALVVEAEDGSKKEYSLIAESNFVDLDSAIQQLMIDNNAPSMQLAITKGEKLVYQAQYGYADLNNTELVTTESVYRLASVSKVITAITILKMKDEGLLNFGDTVFGAAGILETDFGTAPFGTDIENITVRHLLDHTSGFTNNPSDAMFQNLDWTIQQVIDDVLDNRQLTTIPGAEYSYSNFGYILLGRIVEKLTGIGYEEYVKQSVLSPLGINNMNVARNEIDEKWPNEVEYFSQGDNLSPYEYNATRCDAMGGWTANATDLARLLVGIDRQNAVADIVSLDAMTTMYFEFFEWGFWGSLPGSSSVVSRLNDEFNFSIVTNTRVIPITLNKDMQDLLKDQISNRTSWPEYDLFDVQ